MRKLIYTEAAEDLRGNKEQWSAYESQGNCVVLAGPGAGKTKTITIKIARLLNEEIRAPRRLACITYSNACVGELLGRLRKLGVGDDDRLRLGTVHSFCLTELVLPYAQMGGVPIPDAIVVASPAQSRKIFEEAYVQTLGGFPDGTARSAINSAAPSSTATARHGNRGSQARQPSFRPTRHSC